MKKTILLGAFLALTSLAIAQTQSTTSTTNYLQTSTVIGSKIKDSRGQDVGVIKDFVLDRNTGCLAYVVLSAGTGEVLTTSTKTVAAPWAVFTASSDPRVYITRVEREKIYGAPVWESTRAVEYSRTEYINSVYGYYGIAAPRFDAQLSVGVTNTNTSSTTNPTAAPAPAASTAPAATPAATVQPMPSRAGTPGHTPIPPVTAPPSSSKKPASTRAPAKETSSPSTKAESKSERKSADEPAKKSEKASTRTETKREKAEPESESPRKSTKQKKEPMEPSSEPESASTPKEPKEP
jgi:sporulation protein YlmC with PRC-barrel domain